MVLSFGLMFNSSLPSYDSIAFVQNSMAYLNTKNTLRSRVSMILMKGELSQIHSVATVWLGGWSYETISDLMNLQDQIDSFQKMIFAHFRHSANNECRISALVPLVKESWGIYRFITSMLRAMHRSNCDLLDCTRAEYWPEFAGTNDPEALEPLRSRFSSQHYALRKFYYECSNLKYLTSLINVPKLGQVSA